MQHSNVLIQPGSYFCSPYSCLKPPLTPHHKGVWSQRAAKCSLCAIGSLFSQTLWFIFLLHPSLFLRINSHPPFLFGLLQYYLQCSQSLTLYFRLVSPFPQFCVSAHPSVSFPSPSPSLLLAPLLLLLLAVHIAVCWELKKKNRLGQYPVTRRVDLASARKTERENGRRKKKE